MDRKHLKGRYGDKANAVLAADGYNFGLLLRWLAAFLCAYRSTSARRARTAFCMISDSSRTIRGISESRSRPV